MTRLCVVLLATAGLAAQPPKEKTVPADDKMLSKLAYPEVGKAVEVTVVEFGKPSPEGQIPAPKEGKKVAGKVPAKGPYRLGADGWFDADGLNLTKLDKDSCLLKLRPVAGAAGVDGMAQAEVKDVITHVDGVAVTSAEALWFAIDRAKDKADVSVVVQDHKTGNQYLQYVSLNKAKE